VELSPVNYRITEVAGWVIVTPFGKAENNEPLRLRHLFRRWLTRQGVRVIVNLKQRAIRSMGGGLLTSFKRQVDQRVGVLRLCNLDPALQGYFNHDRFSECFEIYNDFVHRRKWQHR
jgi:hypothetical protein